MKKSLMVLAAILTAGSAFAGKTILDPDFNTVPKKTELAGAKIEEGKLIIPGKGGFASALFTRDITAPFTLTCEIKSLGKKEGAKDGHFGFHFIKDEKHTAILYCNKLVWWGAWNNGGMVIDKMNYPEGKTLKIKIVVTKDSLTMTCGDKQSPKLKGDFLPLKGLRFYGFQWDVEVTNLTVTLND